MKLAYTLKEIADEHGLMVDELKPLVGSIVQPVAVVPRKKLIRSEDVSTLVAAATKAREEALKDCAKVLTWEAVFKPTPTRPHPRYVYDLRDGKSYVYFIGGNVGCIKIGFSTAPWQRLKTLRNSSPIPIGIMAMVQGDRSLEQLYHERFAEHRRHGEWFERAPELIAEIEILAAAYDRVPLEMAA